MHSNGSSPAPAPRSCSPERLRHLHLVAAARASAVRPTDPQQVADIVRVTVDDEVDTRTFKAIVSDVSAEVLRCPAPPQPLGRRRGVPAQEASRSARRAATTAR